MMNKLNNTIELLVRDFETGEAFKIIEEGIMKFELSNCEMLTIYFHLSPKHVWKTYNPTEKIFISEEINQYVEKIKFMTTYKQYDMPNILENNSHGQVEYLMPIIFFRDVE